MTAAEWEPIERDLGLQEALPDPQLEFRTLFHFMKAKLESIYIYILYIVYLKH